VAYQDGSVEVTGSPTEKAILSWGLDVSSLATKTSISVDIVKIISFLRTTFFPCPAGTS
jgi:magnesium-transporting ATPase (P-type)